MGLVDCAQSGWGMGGDCANPAASFNVSIGQSRRNRAPMAEEKVDSSLSTTIEKPHHNRWLMLIAAFKVAQALLFINGELINVSGGQKTGI